MSRAITRLPFATKAQIDAALPAVLGQLRRDAVIAAPTDTVYGFGGAVTVAATAALRRLKRREPRKPFLLLIRAPDQAPGVQWTDTSRTLARLFWPGPLTIVVPVEPGSFPDDVVSEDGAVAIRAPDHDGTQAILRAWGAPLTSSSANAPGHPPARDADGAAAALGELGARDALVLDGGQLRASPSSTLVACEDSIVRVLREGAVDRLTLRNRLLGTGIDVE